MNLPERLWVLDTEGNGRHPVGIVELAVVETVALRPTGRSHSWRFRPDEGVTRHATRVHGIVDADLVGEPAIAEMASILTDLLGDRPIVGHAVQNDLDALQAALPGWRPVAAYDTLRLARHALPGLERHGLQGLGDHLGLHGEAARLSGGALHSALYDATLTALAMERMMRCLPVGETSSVAARIDVVAMRRERELGLLRRRQRVERRRAAREGVDYLPLPATR